MDHASSISTEYYKVFYYVGRLGSITAAAEALCISQPAASQAIKQLEKALNTKLFLRTQKGVRLTTEGKLLYPYVERGMENLMDGEEMLKRLVDMDMGEVRIGASDMTLQFFLLPYLEQFHKEYPKIKVTVTNAPTPETIRCLEEGKIDFGVVTTPFSGHGAIHSTEVKPIDNVFIAGSSFKELQGKELDYSILCDLPCIFLEKNTSTRLFMDQFLSQKGIELKPEFELATSDMIVQFARRNMGVGCVMEGFAEEAIERGEVFALSFKEKMPSRSICLVTGESGLMSMAGKHLLELLTGK